LKQLSPQQGRKSFARHPNHPIEPTFHHVAADFPIPADSPLRHLTVARPNKDQSLPHLGVVGDTYTILLSGDDTDGRYSLMDMFIPPGGGLRDGTGTPLKS
jgi:hypothetical protein